MKSPFRSHVFVGLMVGCLLALAAVPRGKAAVTLSEFYQIDLARPYVYYQTFDYSAALILAADGNFYGTTDETIFRLSPDAVLTTLYTFDTDADGSPVGKLLQAADGNFYGATTVSYPMDNYLGTIYRITPDGVYTTIYRFTSDPDLGSVPNGSLVQGPDGDLYGTTRTGGTIFVDGVESTGYGTVFKLSLADGTLTVLYRFNNDQGSTPDTGLLLASDGNFYGVVQYNRFTTGAVIYRVAPDGTFGVVHRFDGTDGVNATSLPIEGSDGNLYGTAGAGVYRLALDGTLTVVHTFGDTDGGGSSAPLVEGSDGNFYGTTPTGGDYGSGTIFKLAPDGTLTTLRSFDGVDGENPVGGLLQAADGSFYGATSVTLNPSYKTDAVPSEIFHLTMDDSPSVPVVTITTVPQPEPYAYDNSDLGVRFTLSSPPDTNLKVRCRLKGHNLSGDAVIVDVKFKIKAGQTSRFFANDAFLPDSLDYTVPQFTAEKIKIKVLPHDGYTLGEDHATKVYREPRTGL